MDAQPTASRRIIDHRKIALHGLPPLLALLVGALLGWRTFAGSTADPDRDIVLGAVSPALDRGTDFWAARLGGAWRAPHVVFEGDGGEATPCGRADAAAGPFYCPASERVYVDLGFLRAIHGDLARGYVIAHELGHHVQKLTRPTEQRGSIAIELEADCYAGQWMGDEQAHGRLARGDIAAALAEAAAVGDDRICPGCSPEQWTHGSGAERVSSVQLGIGGGPCP